MLEVAKDSGGCPNDSRTKRCSICDNKCSITNKLNRLWRWEWRPRTWISRAVILLSMLNVVLAQFSPQEYGETDGNGHYSSQWAVHIEGGQEVADRIAAKHNFVNLGKIFEDLYHFEHRRLQKRSLTPHAQYHRNLINETQVKWAQQQVVKRRSKRDLIPLRPRIKSSIVRFNDVEWPQMWYLNRGQGLDMNVQTAWQEGISGKGVVVTILDDGLEKTHPDLMANYDPQASYDVNNHDEDPMPRYDSTDSNRHGTRCAGEVAAVANNSLCSVGVAFGANVGGVRMLDGEVTDAVEARSLSLNPQHIDIYSASWGPDDDGKTVDGPGELATRAFIEGVTKGRQGKGSIFVWASGNGGREHDNCNCDGYTNSIWTLSISSATENGLVPWYSEACSSTLATTYSSGSVREKQIVTTDLRHKCTNGHTGTSASAPLAAGICALALEANKDLTWRDMQHIVVRTARPANLKSSDWKVNGVGRNVSHSFGYGLMDASAMVKLARTWKTVPEQHRCEVSAPHVDKLIPPRSKVILSLNVTECAGVNFLEHVQAKISLSSSRRGDLQIYLTSPAGTRSTLLAKRPQDSSRNPFNAWPFMSVHTWGEMPFGTWQLEIHNEGRFLGRANLQEWSLLFYGTAYIPGGISDEKPSRVFGSKSSPTKTNAIHVNTKSNKNTFTSPSYSNRKNLKNWKTKSATSRIGKISNPGIVSNGNGSKVSPTVSAKSSKSSQRLWHSNKSKELTSSRGLSKTTSAPLSSHGLPLTLVLGPNGNLTSHQKVPLVFQKYPKVQQLYPLYVNASRMYNEENLLYPKIELSSSKAHDFIAKPGSKSYISGQKTERQNRFDTSSLTRTSNEGKISAKKPPSRNQQNQGHFEGWQMLFYGTEDTPNEDIVFNDKSNKNGKSKLKNMYANKANIEDDVSNHLEAETSNRGWKDQATRRDDVTRTTTGPLGSPSSGCLSYSKPSSQCIGRGSTGYVLRKPKTGELRGKCSEAWDPHQLRPPVGVGNTNFTSHKTFIAKPPKCEPGLYLYEGRCEANCPPATYPATNVKERPACMPCHFTCLMCAGESEAHCTSCHNDSVPTPSGLLDVKESTRYEWSMEAEDMNEGILLADKPKPKDEHQPEMDEGGHLSWGKRDVDGLVRKSKSVFNERAVIKKILEPHNAPRTLYYCYPARVVEKMESAKWYYTMTVLFAVNLVVLMGVLVYLLSKRFCLRRKAESSLSQINYRYLKGNNGISLMKPTDGENILYISSSSDEEA